MTNPTPPTTNNNEMPLIAHIEELRKRLIRSALAVILCAIPAGIFWRQIFEAAAVFPLRYADPIPRIIYTAPAETIMLSFKIALTCGAVFASPFIFFQIWTFVAPGLYKKEKAVVLPAVLASSLCFFAGIAFCYFMLPMLLKFLTGFAGESFEPFYRIDEYLAFLIKMCLAFGLAFELPVISFVLAKIGLIDHRFLIKYFRFAIVAIFILAAIITPPDVLSQILLAVPLTLLYGISIFIAFLAAKKNNYVIRHSDLRG